MNLLKIMIVVLMFCGCAGTQESMDKREAREFEHALRSDEILAERQICIDEGGRIAIRRRGGVTRAQAASNVVGRWDTWYCDDRL